MGILSYLFDHDLLQRHDIEQLKEQQQRTFRLTRHAARGEKMKTDARLSELEGDVGELALFCRTAVTLMIEKGLITQEEFLRRMNEVDKSDGKSDGKYTGK